MNRVDAAFLKDYGPIEQETTEIVVIEIVVDSAYQATFEEELDSALDNFREAHGAEVTIRERVSGGFQANAEILDGRKIP